MKKFLLSLILLGAVNLIAGQTTGSITVNGAAEQTCSISNSPSLTLTFSGVNDVNSNFNIDIICNNGLNWTTTIDSGGSPNGELRRATSGVNHITYRLYSNASMTNEIKAITSNTITGTATGSLDSINIYAKVAMVDNNPLPPAGTYSDTLNVTISW